MTGKRVRMGYSTDMSKHTQRFTPPPGEELDFPHKPMSLEELADWLGVSRRFLELQVEKGKLRGLEEVWSVRCQPRLAAQQHSNDCRLLSGYED